jgi:hypothetical protein
MSKLMQFRYRAARSLLRSPLIWLRNRGLDANDVFLASYARSGSTLPRFQLAEALTGTACSFDDIQQVVPEIGIHVRARVVFPGGGRLIKTHERYRRDYKGAIYIVRDLRDVLLSAFAREKAMGLLSVHTLDEYIEPFMQGKMVRFGPWTNHVEEWLNSPLMNSGGLLVMRYEDMRTDVEGSLARMLQFLGVQLDREAIHQICVNNSIEQMRPKEDQARRLPKSAGEEGRQVGKGAVQGWRQKLSATQLKLVDDYAGPTLARLGYPTGPTAIEVAESHNNGSAPLAPLKFVSVNGGRSAYSLSTNSRGLASSTNMPSFAQECRKSLAGLVANYFSWYRY